MKHSTMYAQITGLGALRMRGKFCAAHPKIALVCHLSAAPTCQLLNFLWGAQMRIVKIRMPLAAFA